MSQNHNQDRDQEQVDTNKDRLLFGGLLATCVGFLAQLADKTPDRGSFLWLASIFFAVAMPILSTSLLLEMGRTTSVAKPRGQLLFDAIGVLASVAAIALIFLNVNLWAGYTFFGAAFVAISLVLRGRRH